ncbi:MAG: hypothetical protein JST63_20865 [Bacteroidetes bacterium]|nr:hypothetical protein [Bacteroidota bacterium]
MFPFIFKRLTIYGFLAVSLFSGCKKSASGTEAVNGEAFIQFTTDYLLGGKYEFKSNSTIGGFATKTNTADKTKIIITAVQMDNPQIGTAMLTIYVPQNYSGAISGKFENSSNENTQSVLAISISTGGTIREDYTSIIGNYNITKLTGSEIEGSFDAYCKNETGGNNISISSGKFSGKF